jgi:hypothetical protein
MGFDLLKYVLIAIGGALACAGLLLQYAVGVLTEARALRGSPGKKRTAYAIRIAAAVAAYAVVIVVARLFASSTAQSTSEALVLVAAGALTLIAGGTRLKRWKEGRAPSRR